ncbi:isocitrate lyase/PEP mutase family protein [Stenotrophomonas oahuensis]|uniref:Isocitrate lyase/phosphoenolpyruvate mutase family protein n=1 Tax=Stenotrophomonas oahuensis TaxID=3003271 RepID=A0ABY9YK63_9GAMM|nr:isocitrate lyase/phosphoenolpyruvate mutase family protein [Stenotrophomonas sp. A5586]WNH51093.1 isocitrate lyase/phosphoenolpyruvate mutase family protein [Stenotrophomonas sp. A5586]
MSNLHARFAELHTAHALLVLPNAWDAGSARLAQEQGAQAVGTTSAAMAWSCGYADGSALPRISLLQRVAEIVHATSIPITVDIEDGYSDDPQQVAALAVSLAELGVVGINLEDGTGAPALLADKIAAIRAALAGRPFFINARTDVYLRGLAEGQAAVAMTVERLQAYAAAGADGAFVPGLKEPGDIAAVVAGITLPLNVMWLPGIGTHAELLAAGVRRLSAGPALYAHAWSAVETATRAMFDDTLAMPAPPPSYAALNALFG